jgi:hypothetical protein
MSWKTLVIVVVALLLTACQTLPTQRVHQRVLDQPQLVESPGQVVLLPLDIEVREMSASGLSDVVPGWTEQAKRNIRQSLLARAIPLMAGQTLESAPELTDAERQVVDEHVALAKLVWADAMILSRFGGEAWRHKATHFDYGLGDGLAFLAQRTGAGKALIVSGQDVHTTSGRKALAFGLAALGVAVPLGTTSLTAKLIDLRTGEVLWMNSWFSGGAASLLDPKATDAAIEQLFEAYPGLDDYRKLAGGKD